MWFGNEESGNYATISGKASGSFQNTVDLRPPLADAAVAFQGGDAQRLFLDEVHPSAEGHARVAEVLAQALEGWARQP